MSRVPTIPDPYKEHPNLPHEQEEQERILREAEESDRAFYDEAARISQDVTFLKTGVREKIAHSLTSGEGISLNSLQQRLLEEKVQAGLYRNVQGNEIAETERGNDRKNYTNSRTVEHLRSGLPSRTGRRFLGVLRGAGSMIGLNNSVEAAISKRFGKVKDMPSRRSFLAQRLADEELSGLMPAHIDLIRNVLQTNRNFGVPTVALLTSVADIANCLSAMNLLQLRLFQQWAREHGMADLAYSPVFKDLYMLVDQESEHKADFGTEEVYDVVKLRQFLKNDLPPGTPGYVSLGSTDVFFPGSAPRPFNEVLEQILTRDSLVALEDKPESVALLAELRNQIYNNAILQNLAGEDNPRKIYQPMTDEIREIMSELPEGQLSADDKQRLNTCRSEVSPLLSEATNSAPKLNALSGQISALNTAIDDITKPAGDLYSAKEAQRTATKDRVKDLKDNHIDKQNTLIGTIDLQIDGLNTAIAKPGLTPGEIKALRAQLKEYLQQRQNLAEQVRKAEQEWLKLQVEPVPSPTVDKIQAKLEGLQTKKAQLETDFSAAESNIRTQAAKMSEILRNAKVMNLAQDNNLVSHITIGTKSVNVFDLLADPSAKLDSAVMSQVIISFGQLKTKVIDQLEKLARPPAKIEPFVLLQRILRRQYLRSHNLPVDSQDQMADKVAAIQAGMRVSKVKSLDRKRTANSQAAEAYNRGIVSRGWNGLKGAISSGQDFIGLEAIEFKDMKADKLLKQLINSDPRFAPFNGIDKFTTTRDLNRILNQSGSEVPKETLELFAQTLEEAISRFKKVRPEASSGLDPNDWDLENMLDVFKKVQVTRWTKEFLEEVDKSAGSESRGTTLVRLLADSRKKEREIEDSIMRDIKHPDSAWRLQLVKSQLKRILNKDSLEAMNRIKKSGIEQTRKEIKKLENRMSALPEGDPGKTALAKEILNLQKSIKTVEKQIQDASDLYERVEAARKYLDENDLSRRERKEYLQSVGLTQVFDKMSTNFRLQKTWKYTKRGAAAMWSGTKKGWAWSRKKFLNAATAKSAASKTFSVGRLIATPVTAPIGWAWKAGTFPFRLVGRAMSRSVDAPWWLAGQVSKAPLRRYYRQRVIDQTEHMEKLVAKRNKIHANVNKGPYSWDKTRMARKANRIEEEIYSENRVLNDIKKAAAAKQVDLGELAIYTEVANDNGEIIINKAAA